jgi:hypothetical protein
MAAIVFCTYLPLLIASKWLPRSQRASGLLKMRNTTASIRHRWVLAKHSHHHPTEAPPSKKKVLLAIDVHGTGQRTAMPTHIGSGSWAENAS